MADKDSQSQNAFFKLVGNIKQRASDWNAMRKERKQAAKEVKAKIEETKEAEMDEEQREQELSKHQRRLDELQPGRAKLKKFTGAAGVAAVGVGAWLASKFKRNKQPSYHEVDSATAWQLNLFILFAALFHYIVLIQDFTIGEKLIFNIIFAIIVYFLFVPIDEKAQAIRELFFVVFVFYFGIESISVLLVESIPQGAVLFLHAYILNPLLMPWWLYYAVFIRAKARTKISKFIFIAIFVIWVFFLLGVGPVLGSTITGTSTPLLDKNVVLTQTQVDNFKAFLKTSVDSWSVIWQKISKSVTNLKLFWYKRIDAATGGDYYTGRVEQAEDEPLGVTIEDVKTADYEFEPEEKKVVYGIIKARTLDEGITITPGCYLGYKTDTNSQFIDGDLNLGSSISASPEYVVFDTDEQDIDCSFAPTEEINQLLKKSKKVTLTAEFNFETMAYLKTYFMYQDRIRALMREDKDPLGEFGISEKNPTAVFTNGPVMLGIGTKKPPFGVASIADISSSTDNLFKIGVTVDNNYGWHGKIKRINDVIIEVPDSLVIDFATCSHVFKEYADENNLKPCVDDYMAANSRPFIECADKFYSEPGAKKFDRYNKASLALAKQYAPVQECVLQVCKKEFDGYRGYKLEPFFISKQLEDIENYKTFSCKFRVDDVTKLLGTSPVTTKYIRARVRYDYEVEASTYLRVKPEQQTVGSYGIMDHTQSVYDNPQKAVETIGQKSWASINAYAGGIEPCTVIGLIMHTTAGDPTYSQNGKSGIMGLSPQLAKLVAAKFGEQNLGLFNIDTSVKYGLQLLNDIKTGQTAYLGASDPLTITNKDELIIVFLDSIANDKIIYDSIKPSIKESCNGQKAYLCPQDPYYAKYNTAILTIKAYEEYCQKPEIQAMLEQVKNVDQLTEVKPTNFWSTPKEITISKDKNTINPSLEQRYSVKVTSKIINTETKQFKVALSISLNNVNIFTKSFDINPSNLDTQWYSGTDYPFIRVRLKSANLESGIANFEVQDFELTRVKKKILYTSFLVKNDVWTDSTIPPTSILKTFYNYPTKSLDFYTADDKKICSIKPSQTKTCPYIPQLKAYRTSSDDDPFFEGYIEFNPENDMIY